MGTSLKDLKSLSILSLDFEYFNFIKLGISRARKVVKIFSQLLREFIVLVKTQKAASCIQRLCGIDNKVFFLKKQYQSFRSGTLRFGNRSQRPEEFNQFVPQFRVLLILSN